MRRDFQIVRRRLVLENTASHVKRGTVAGAEKATTPIGLHAAHRTGLELVRRRATQVGTNTDSHKHFGLDGAAFVACVFGRQLGWLALGLGISQLTVQFGQFCKLLWRTFDDPDRLAAPFNSDFFAGLDAGNINFNSGTSRFCLFGRVERADKWDCCSNCTYAANGSGGNNPVSFIFIQRGTFWGAIRACVGHESPSRTGLK